MLLLVVSASHAGETVSLRDITVMPSDGSATIQFLVDGDVGTVVVERHDDATAEVRMKSIRADQRALGSAVVRTGVRSVAAHIERGDVLVADVRFDHRVESLHVVRRDAEAIVVNVTLGSPLRDEATPIASNDSRRGRWALSTIVIDAGHGGKDPGAIGLHHAVEKDITLAVARMLRDELKTSMPGVEIVMTRNSDRFVELYRRGQIANEHDGRLFVSIHCNAMPSKPNPANGFECYILRPGRSEDAARVAATENAAIRFENDQKKYEGMATESAIVASMAQSAFARFSEEVANAIRGSLRGATAIDDSGVHQAGFYVLVGASMPAVLVELGYLTNESDVKVLTSRSGQKDLAHAIADGVRDYESVYSEALD